MLATGLEYELAECAIVKLIIPPLELPDGTKILLRKTQAVFPPIRFLIDNPKGGDPIQASFNVADSKWEIVST